MREAWLHWRRSVDPKIWGSWSIRSSHQTVSDYILRQWFPNTQQSRFLATCRRLEILVLPSIHKSVIADDVKFCGVIQQQFWMKEWDIWGSRNILWSLLHIFSGGHDPQPSRMYAPVVVVALRAVYKARSTHCQDEPIRDVASWWWCGTTLKWQLRLSFLQRRRTTRVTSLVTSYATSYVTWLIRRNFPSLVAAAAAERAAASIEWSEK